METVTSEQVLENWSSTLKSAKVNPIAISEQGETTLVMLDAKLAQEALEALRLFLEKLT